MYKLLLFIVLLLIHKIDYSQDYHYIHYTINDGVAANTVYDIAQDVNGYLFFATENGLTRFDGRDWKTFTVKDGLPDNEVIRLHIDKYERLWIFTFNSKVCYIYKGILYNSSKDSLLTNLTFKHPCQTFIQTEDSTLFMIGVSNVYRINKSFLSNIWKSNGASQLVSFTKSNSENQWILLNSDSTFAYKNDSLVFIGKSNFNRNLVSNTLTKGYNSNAFMGSSIRTVDSFKDSIKFINTDNGVWVCDFNNNKIINHFLNGKKVGHTFLDIEGNYWFTTLGEGIYKLPSKFIFKFSFSQVNKKKNTAIVNNEVYCISNTENYLLAGMSFGKLLKMDSAKLSILDYQKYIKNSLNSKDINRATSSLKVNPSTTIIGFDSYLLKLQDNKPSFNYNVMPVKSVEKIDDKNIIVATGNHCYKIRINDLKIVDTIWDDRTTYAFHQNNQNYIGTLTGLYVIGENKKQTFLGNLNAALTRRIVCIKSANDGTLYIATADNGIVALKNNKVFRVINDENGLSSNSCKTLHINKNFLWVGTINGITKIDLGRKNAIIKYSTSDGLPSNIINAIYVDDADSTVWVGSPEGLTSFKEKDVVSKSICNLVMQKITVSGNNLSTDSNNFQLKYTDNNIRFQFAGISFRSADDITYFYKIKELDNTWRKTKERVLNYPTLESGNYSFLIYATNKYGVISKTIQINFNIATPFWKTWWFNTLLAMICIAAIYFFLKRRFDKAKKLQSEKALASQQLASMEQMALQAQMNPHFIFNCLNSIQQFILFGDIENANKYLTDFAILVRSTLDNSSLKNITVEEEVLYLKRYLELEQLRFGDSFTFEIVIDKSVDKGFTKMPAMLLQPLVENSLRHGIRPQKDKKGIVKISFFETDGYLVCSVWDNGIGRAASAKLKTDNHIQYQSKGMELTIKRIQLLNTEVANKASVKVLDIKDDNNIVIGTEIILKLPLGKN